ncbi:hypothetical protein [Nocardioides sp. GY 10127]|uniref:hypothetical protein n=1 Tax=Nocardioides sp. GY 10127 TaxID=2569762 RepID=UPI0010A8B53C|nr:hypothetical protein [Nocardioides sp. GY 10127]TIC78766.1 hypothetical protein E8D37_18900 [Nocardioides sp. GY 10127]
MPLDRDHVTMSARLRLPAWAAFAAVVGVVYVTDPGHRLAGLPSFPFFPAAMWGAGFCVIAGTLATALAMHLRGGYTAGLALLLVWLGLWSGTLVVGAVTGDATFTAWAFPGLLAYLAWTEMVALIGREQ